MPEGATRMDRSPQSQKCVECLMPCGYNTPTVCPQPAAVIIRCKLANDEMQACRREFRSKCTLNPLMAMSHLLELTGQTGSGVNIVIAFGLLQGICFFSLGEECRHCFAQQAKRLSDTSRCMCVCVYVCVRALMLNSFLCVLISNFQDNLTTNNQSTHGIQVPIIPTFRNSRFIM
eukprot:scaffold78036_cov17-Tisochrysis_lutea.AAC.1